MSDASETVDTREGWTLSEAAAHTGRSTASFRRWVASGDLFAWRYNERGPWYVSPDDVARMIRTNRGRL